MLFGKETTNKQVSWPFLRFKKNVTTFGEPTQQNFNYIKSKKTDHTLGKFDRSNFPSEYHKAIKDIKWWNQPQGDGIEITPKEKVGCC